MSQEKSKTQDHYTRPDDSTILDFLPSSKIIVGHSDIHGRGVFSRVPIDKGEIIERCPLIQMEYRSKYQLDPQIFNYMYAQPPCKCNDCQNHGFIIHMVLGYGMLYNHQDFPNALWKFNYTQLLADVIASKDIAANEEIFVSYGNEYFIGKQKIENYAKNY
jgi:SET domain-containing protein